MKKAKFLAVAIAAFALVALALVGCSSGSANSSASSSSASASSSSASSDASSSSASASSSAASGSIDKLVVGFDAEYPPYGYMDADGSYTGFDLDLAQAVCEMNGWEYEAKPIDWDSKDMELQSGNINCIWNGFTMESREGQYTFSDPYMLNGQVVVTMANSGIASLADLAGKKVVTQEGSAGYDILVGEEATQAELAATFGQLDTVADYNSAFMNLQSGAADAVVCDLSIAQYNMAGSSDYVMLADRLSEENYAVGFALGDTETAEIVSDSLRSLYEDGTVAKLIDKYAEYEMSIDNWLLK